MKALEFLIMIRDELYACPQSKEQDCIGLPSNGELRRWLDKKVIKCNGELLTKESEISFPVTEFVFFPKNDKFRTTLI